MSRTSTLVAMALLLWAAAPAGAEIYKWVDAQGNIHFSDSPPRGAEAVDLSPDTGAPGEARREGGEGIPYAGSDPSRLAFLKQVMVHFEDVPPGRHKEIGEMRSGPSCAHPQAIRIQSGHALKREASLRWHFHDLLRELGYRSPREIRTSFDAEEEMGSDLSIIAVITALEVSECVDGASSSGQRRSGRAPQARQRVMNSSSMTVEWQVKDNLQRRLVYEATTDGSFRDSHFVERTDDLPGSLERAFREAGRELLADRAFVALLEPSNGVSPRHAEAPEQLEKVSARVQEGRCAGRGPGFQARFEALRESTATIRTPLGHGSGFLISAEGLVLTNEHVVGANRQVLVILGDEEYPGQVVARDPVRDVAVVELAGAPPVAPLPVCRGRADVGDTVYVVGTPLDEKLSLSVTKGIISQHRTMKGQPFYQTDAVINKGNSGGPAFNDQGEVIGIAAAGIFAQDGAGMGINYLIPIEEALGAVIDEPRPAARQR